MAIALHEKHKIFHLLLLSSRNIYKTHVFALHESKANQGWLMLREILLERVINIYTVYTLSKLVIVVVGASYRKSHFICFHFLKQVAV